MEGNKLYLREIKNLLPSKSSRTKMFLNNLKTQIHEFEEENDSYTYENLVKEFGTPEEVVVAYFGESRHAEMSSNLKTNKCFKYIAIAVIVIITIVGLFEIYRLNDLYEIVKNERPDRNEITWEE